MKNEELEALYRILNSGLIMAQVMPDVFKQQFLNDLQTLTEYGKVQSKRNLIKVVK